MAADVVRIDFKKGQTVRIKPTADNAVGSLGTILSVDDVTCEVDVKDGSGGFSGAFLKRDLEIVD